MKTKFLLAVAALSIAFVGCNREDDPVFNAQTAKVSAEMDVIADDVSQIAEEEYKNQEANAGRPDNVTALLPACATVTTTFDDFTQTWTSVIDFGDSNCSLANGNSVRGEITVSGSSNFDQTSYDVSYTFNNFYHNDRLVQGTRDVTFTWESTAAQADQHTVANIDLDLTVTYPNGNEYHRTGHRIRELIAGYGTPFNWIDNTYQVSGQWTTTGPNGSWSSTIGTPLVYNVQCGYIASGTLEFTTDSNNALLDYGDGLCDWFATLTINGGNETTITLN
ncbi:MAG: hypothetical protein EOO50_06695 [Flavobacterium sp.]|uniref:hypothetical protein n=1 Tax=Flavobacterium sp. TaxID=239 RepID=UPI00121B0A85|nr:hypothetical protein [Flavobacterium sp.]RZJ67206.1 MAG: hypothetical protein EOO50_06695 [Flavobacterium sp.]